MASGDTVRLEVSERRRGGGFAWTVQAFRGGRQKTVGQGVEDDQLAALRRASERAEACLEAEIGTGP